MYENSWLILLAPLAAFAVIIFGTRIWDLLSRPDRHSSASATVHGDAHGHNGHVSHADAHGADEHGHSLQDEDDDPKVPALTAGAKVSGYVAILIMAAACIYSWVLLLSSVFNPAGLPEAGVTL